MNQLKTLSIIKYIFAGIGALLIGASLWLYSDTNEFISTALQAEGVVIDFSRESGSYKPIAQFETQRGEKIEFISDLSTNPPLFDSGEVITVLYRADDPHNAKINEFWSLYFANVLLGGLGSIFFSIGGGMMLFTSRRQKRTERLRREGTRVEAKFTGVELNRFVRVNNRNPYRIICEWQDPMSSKSYVFRSENLWFDPTEQIDRETLTVFIDRNNPKMHYVDISFLRNVIR